jgi:hypothetical protein
MWRRRRDKPAASEPADIFGDLRTQVLTLDPRTADFEPSPEHPRVWGALMEMGMDVGVASLVGLVDGSTSLYLSSGGGMIGGGEHEAIADATRRFLGVLEEHLDELSPDTDSELPGDHEVDIRALTYDGRLSARAVDDDLAEERHPLSPVFYAGQDVITLLRQASPD